MREGGKEKSRRKWTRPGFGPDLGTFYLPNEKTITQSWL
jgi:hypothetical protein